jgi:poly(3-hydroxybutyrate) depolymerase
VAPQGIDNGWAGASTTDAKLLDDIIEAVKNDLCIDTTRIFAVGFSYGAMFSSTLACVRSDVFRALAPQNGSGSCAQPKKVAFIGVGSTDGTNKSLQSYARTIAKANGCSDPANQEMPIPAAGSRLHTCTSFTGCPPEYPVRFCAFDEGHKSAPYDGANGDLDDGNKTWVPGEVWKFFTQF